MFDSLEDGGLRSSAPYASTAEIAEQENDRSLGELHDRVNILKRVRCSLLLDVVIWNDDGM